MPARQENVHGLGVGDLTSEADGRTAEREQAPAGLGHAEPGALARDADVGGLEDLGAAGDGRALDGGDERLGRLAVAKACGWVGGGRALAMVPTRAWATAAIASGVQWVS